MSAPICLYCGHPLHRDESPSDLLVCLEPGCGYALAAQAFESSFTGEYREVNLAGTRAVRA